MQKNQRMMVGLLALVMLLTACQPTPEAEPVIQKDTDKLIEMAVGVENPEAEPTPEGVLLGEQAVYAETRYQWEGEMQEGNLLIHVDATVRYPENLSLPVARMEAIPFDQQWVYGIFSTLFTKKGLVAYEQRDNEVHVATKQEIAEQIAAYEEALQKQETDSQYMMTPSEVQEEIEKLKEEFKTAPDETEVEPSKVSDGTYWDGAFSNGREELSHMLELTVATEKGDYLNVHTWGEGDDRSFGPYLVYSTQRYETYRGQEPYTTDYVPEEAYYRVLSQEEAQGADCQGALAHAKALLKEVGADGYAVAKTRAYTPAEGYCAYEFSFVPTVVGYPHALLREYWCQGDGYTIPWYYETLTVVADEEGVLSLTWGNPTKVTEIVSLGTPCLSFEEAREIFEKQMEYVWGPKTVRYDGLQWKYDLYVTRAELSLLRIREKNSQELSGLYVPAWVFYGYRADDDGSYQEGSPENCMTILCINAMDGSIVDTSVGY